MKHGTARGARRSIGRGFALVLGFALAGCSSANPIEWYRSAVGTSANDPAPDASYTAPLEAGSEQPYPNLASVPPPPTRALSTAERESLTQQLIADRANAHYIDEQLRAGPGPSVSPPGAAPPPPPLSQNDERTRKPPSSAKEPPPADAAPAEAAPAKTPAKAAPAKTPAKAAASSSPAAAPAAAAAPQPQASRTSPRSSVVSLDAPDPNPGSSPSSSAAGGSPAAAPAPEPEPEMVSPSVRSLPEPETPRPAPPPPSRSLTGTKPGPAPSAPVSSAAASRTDLVPAAASAPGAVLGRVNFAPNSARLGAADRKAVQAAARAQQQSGATIRVVGHGGGGNSPAQQLAGFRMALDRANAVAGALTEAGVPSDRILVETAPTEGSGSNKAEIFLGN